MASRWRLTGGLAAAAITAMVATGPALAGQPVPWQLGFQEAASPVMEGIHSFHNLLLVIITVITLFVTALLASRCCDSTVAQARTPTRTTHNTMLEVAWTVLPVIILVASPFPPSVCSTNSSRRPSRTSRSRRPGISGTGATSIPIMTASRSISSCCATTSWNPGSRAFWPPTPRWWCRSTRS
jgi:heme/copper-type cytochrome/quinol oxidase subunit 2